MFVKSIFDGLENADIDKMLKCFDAKKMNFKKDRTIISNIINTKIIGVILNGNANMLRYDYNGNRTIIEKLGINSVFGEVFSRLNGDVSVIATSDCEVLFIDYNRLIERCKKGCFCHNILINNLMQLLSYKVSSLNDRLEVLSKRTIRDKLLTYFELLVKDKPNRTFILPFTYTDLADYLSVDRSAMMREIKNLKEDSIIIVKKRQIVLRNL